MLAAAVGLVAFVIRQRTFAFPMLPADLLRAPGFRSFVMAGLLLFAGYYGLVFVISVYLQQVRGYGPVLTGISFLPSALPITFMPLVAGRINARLGSLRLLLLASALNAVGALLLVLVGSSGPVGMSAGLFVLGAGFGLATVPQITLVMASAPSHRAAIASGMLTVGRQSGTTVGVACWAACSPAAPSSRRPRGPVCTCSCCWPPVPAAAAAGERATSEFNLSDPAPSQQLSRSARQFDARLGRYRVRCHLGSG